MIDFFLFAIFVVLPFFRVFNGTLLQNIHNIIAVVGIGGVILGIIFNRLDEYLTKILRHLIPVLIATIAVHFFLKTYDSAQIKITLLEIGGPLVLILWLIKRVNIGNFNISPYRRYALYPALLFLLSGIISFALSTFKLETFEPGFLRRISYLGVFIVTIFEVNRKEDFERIINWVLVCSFFVVIYGFVQAFGMDWHIWKGAFGTRIFSTFGNPNFFAAWVVLVLPLVLAKIMITRKFYYVILAMGIFYVIFVTGTKGSWVGLAAELSVFVILTTLYLIKGNPRLMKKIALGMIVSVILVTTIGITWFSIKRINSIRFRLFTWSATMKMISEPVFVSPLKALAIGHGIETFKLVYPTYRRPEIFLIEGKHNTETDHAHNEFLEILYDEGIVGIIIYLWLLAGIYYMGLKRLSLMGMGGGKSNSEFYLVSLIAGTAGMIAHSSVSVHVRFVSSGYILWIFLGLLVVHTIPIESPPEKTNANKQLNPIKLILILILLATAGVNSFWASRRFLANIYHNRAIAYSKQKKWKEALSYYHMVQKYHPSFIMAYYFEGNVYNDKLSEALKKKDKEKTEINYKKAVGVYDKVLSMYPNYVQVHFQEGMLHLKVGNTEEAVKSFRKYLNIVDPEYPYTYYRLGMINAQKKDLKKAEWYLQEPSRRKPKLMEAYTNLANLYLAQNKLGKAEQTYHKALKTKENVGILISLAKLYEGWRKKDKAVITYQRILKLQPGNEKIKQKIKLLKS